MTIPGSANPLLMRSAAPTAYQVSRSLRFNSSDSAYLSRTPASAGNRKTWTWAGWVKRSGLGTDQALLDCRPVTSDSQFTIFYLKASNTLELSGPVTTWRTTTQLFRDASAWYHIVLALDTTQSTASSRIKIYVNGVQVTAFATSADPSQNADLGINQSSLHGIGASSGGSPAAFLNGYLADVHFIDGQALDPTSFGEFSATTGVWVPKAYTGSYGTNGFHLDFADNSSNTATTLGKDTSGNGNNWTPNNLSVTAGAGNDSLVDVPTNGAQTDTGVGGEVRGNYCTMNPLDTASGAALTLTNGNLEHANPSTTWRWSRGTFAMTTGKWYWEQTVSDGATGSAGYLAGVATASFDFNVGTGGLYARQSGTKYENGTTTNSVFSSTAAGDILGFAFDADSGKLWVSRNGTFVGSPTAGTGNSWSSVPTGVFPLFAAYNVSGNIMNFGARGFAYTAPSGFKALNTANLPAPLVTKPSTVMDILLWTGTGTGADRTISGLGFSNTPGLIWGKGRSAAYHHTLWDIVRGYGATNVLSSDQTGAAGWAASGRIKTATSSSITWEADSGSLWYDASSTTYVGWCWDAGSSTVTNTQGSITTTVSVRSNTTAGFSVVTYTGTGTNCTVGHGLGVAPSLIIVKSRSAANDWAVYHAANTSDPKTDYLLLNSTAATADDNTYWNDTAPTSTVFSIGTNADVNTNGTTYVAYCWAPLVGYSSFGSYVGNGSADGVFQWCGFRPRWLLIKSSSGATENWVLIDSARDTYNVAGTYLLPNLANAEGSSLPVDLLSNGFKLRGSGGTNQSAVTYVWAAFAESPFAYSRAR